MNKEEKEDGLVSSTPLLSSTCVSEPSLRMLSSEKLDLFFFFFYHVCYFIMELSDSKYGHFLH